MLQAIKASPDGYAAAIGTLTYNAGREQQIKDSDSGPDAQVTNLPARFSGKMLSASGFTRPVTSAISIEYWCWNGWCPHLEADKPALVFLKQSPGGYTISASACGSDIFFDPTQKMLQTTQDCYLNSKCP